MTKVDQLSFTKPCDLKEAIGAITPDNPRPLITNHQQDGILGFKDAMLPDIDNDRVYAQKFNREPKGRGAHFDVYSNLIDDAHPAIGVYNLTGTAFLRALVLSRKLQEYYDETYPEPTDEAFEARREVSKLALAKAGITIMEAKVKPTMGIVFPQFRGGRHLVHDIVPSQAENTILPFELSTGSAGSFVKLVVPKNKSTATEDFKTRGYVPFSQFVEEQIAGISYEEREAASHPVTPPPFHLHPRQPVKMPAFMRGERTATPKKSPCNLD